MPAALHVLTFTLCLVAFATPAPADEMPPGLEMLRRTERGFARATAELGVRNGFLMFFAEDAIAPPSTAPARKALAAIPIPPNPHGTSLEWEPMVGDIARSGELGYLTGPSSYSDRKGTKHYGTYFSVWRRDDLGLWRVILDAGIDMPSPAPEFTDASFHAAADSGWAGGANDAGSTVPASSLEAASAKFDAGALADAATAYSGLLSPHARMHRDGMHPLLGREAIVTYLGSAPGKLRIAPLRSGVSASDELGWTFATCEWSVADSTAKGTLSQVWKRDSSGVWRIVADILSPQRK